MRRSIALPSIVLVALVAVGCSTAAGRDLDLPPGSGVGPAGRSLPRRRWPSPPDRRRPPLFGSARSRRQDRGHGVRPGLQAQRHHRGRPRALRRHPEQHRRDAPRHHVPRRHDDRLRRCRRRQDRRSRRARGRASPSSARSRATPQAGMQGSVTVKGAAAASPSADPNDHGGPMPTNDVAADPNAPAPVTYDATAPALLAGDSPRHRPRHRRRRR